MGLGKGVAQEGGHMCIHIADSFRCTGETKATFVKQLYSNFLKAEAIIFKVHIKPGLFSPHHSSAPGLEDGLHSSAGSNLLSSSFEHHPSWPSMNSSKNKIATIQTLLKEYHCPLQEDLAKHEVGVH